jgi:Spy/CpxP family protein refolding chaperone
MKGIRMAVLGAALVFGMTTAAEAQERGGRGRGGITRLMTDITVSADVQTKIDEIAQKYMTQQREMMTAAGVEPGAMQQMTDEMRTKMTELNAKRNAEIRALLTAEQQVVFDKNVATAAQGRRGGGGGGGATPPPPAV